MHQIQHVSNTCQIFNTYGDCIWIDVPHMKYIENCPVQCGTDTQQQMVTAISWIWLCQISQCDNCCKSHKGQVNISFAFFPCLFRLNYIPIRRKSFIYCANFYCAHVTTMLYLTRAPDEHNRKAQWKKPVSVLYQNLYKQKCRFNVVMSCCLWQWC